MCEIAGERKGPFSDAQLQAMARDGGLAVTDKVWNPAAKRWELAGRLQGLFTAEGEGANGAGAAALAAMSAAAVGVAANDVGPFRVLGNEFSIEHGSDWSGPVVASHAAVYLVKNDTRQGLHAGGIVSNLAKVALDGFDDVRSCRVGDLPEHVRREIDPKSEYADRDAIVLPKDAVGRLQTRMLSSAVVAQCGGDNFTITVGFGKLGDATAFLQGGGWALGDPVRATAAPVHGRGFGRAPGEKSSNALSGGERAVYAVGAVVVCLLIAFLKFQMRRGRMGW
jgi:hypothetical protein